MFKHLFLGVIFCSYHKIVNMFKSTKLPSISRTVNCFFLIESVWGGVEYYYCKNSSWWTERVKNKENNNLGLFLWEKPNRIGANKNRLRQNLHAILPPPQEASELQLYYFEIRNRK